MVSIIVDAHERRDVATADIAGAYLKAYMKDFTVMKFTGASVDILCKMNSKYILFVTGEGGIKVLYVRLIKAIYGCVQSALLWYKMFHQHLKHLGFVINPYDPCIVNKDVNGKQCTIAWYVDDTKVSHAASAVVTEVIAQIEERFGKMTVKRGKEHVFLGMSNRYMPNVTAEITMRDYLEEAIAESGLDIKRTAASPARRDLFELCDKSEALSKSEAESFHHVVAKLLYVDTRARGDILLAIIFLCTRASKSTKQDQAKLRRVLEYLRGTLQHYKYIMGADNLKKLRTWVDASYAVHPDMKSHTGGVMSFGTGGFICKSIKQKLNTKNSTEADEVVGASDYIPDTLWTQEMFLAEQGYQLEENNFAQDNESAMRLEKNGRMSAGQKSWHINIRYFWIKDQVEANKIEIQHCPTLEMLADFFTKPLQGHLFRRFRGVILGHCCHIDTLRINPALPLEERVEESRSSTCDADAPDTNATVDNTGTHVEDTSTSNTSTGTWIEVVSRKRTRKANSGCEQQIVSTHTFLKQSQ